MKSALVAVNFRGRKSAFTVVEMLVVITIIGILASTVMVGLRASRQRTQVGKAKSEMRFYGMALREYRNRHLYDNNKWPAPFVASDGTSCIGDQKRVPTLLVTEGLWKQNQVTQFCYYRHVFGIGEEIGIIWPGISNNPQDITDLNAVTSNGNVLLIIQEPKYTDPSGNIDNDAKGRVDTLKASDKNKIIYMD